MILTVDEKTLSSLPDWAVAAIWAADEQIQDFAKAAGIDAEHCISLARRTDHSSREAWASLKMMGVTKKEVTLMLAAWAIIDAVPMLESKSDGRLKAFFVTLLLSPNLLPTAHVTPSDVARLGARALHGKPGGNWEKIAAIRAAWATGKYTSRDICAEQECAALEMSFSSARKALRRTPDPT